jgi:hypothetical protein
MRRVIYVILILQFSSGAFFGADNDHSESQQPATRGNARKYWPWAGPWQKINGVRANVILGAAGTKVFLQVWIGASSLTYKDVSVKAFDAKGRPIKVAPWDRKITEYVEATDGIASPRGASPDPSLGLSSGNYSLPLRKGRSIDRIEIEFKGEKVTFSNPVFTETYKTPPKSTPPPIPNAPPGS